MMHKTWWGEAFVNALETFIDPARLQRGKAYRTDNRVLAFNIDGNVVTATIRGNINPYFGVTKEPKYKVEIKFNEINKNKWKNIVSSICENPAWLSKLMLNELPSDIQSAFGKENFLPKGFDDITASCTCPDYENPCKHIAGVYFRLAGMLDNHPMLLFPLKGIEATALHQELRKSELGKAFSEHLATPTDIELELHETLYTPVDKSESNALPTIQSFWGDSISQPKNALKNQNGEKEILNTVGALIKKQGDYPPFWDRHNSFIRAMENIYLHVRLKNKAVL